MNIEHKIKNRIKIFLLGLKIMFYIFFDEKKHGPLTICGDVEFQELSVKALDILEKNDKDAYRLIVDNVAFLCQYKTSGIFPITIPTICIINKETIKHSSFYYIGILCHEAYHVFLCNQFKKEHYLCKDIPEETYSGKSAEIKCVKYARDVLKNLDVDISDFLPIQEVINSRWWEVPWSEQNC